MQLDLKKIPFGRRLSRHLIYEETDPLGTGWARGLYLGLAAESGGGFIGGPAAGPAGFIRITPTFVGGELAYTYTATPAFVALETAEGSVRFALDGAKVLRIEGKAVGLRLNGRLGFGGNAIKTGRGVELTMGAAVYLIKALKGSVTLDCRWALKALRCTDPVICIEPGEDGTFDLAVYDTDDAYELPGIAESLDGCAAASAADYAAFAAGLPEPGDDGPLGPAAYALWMGFLPFKGRELICAGKLSDPKLYALEQFAAALALKDASASLELIGGMLGFATARGLVPAWAADRQCLYEAVPPVYAYTVSRLIGNGSINDVSREKLSGFYEAMSGAVGWWLDNRASDAGLCFYAYRHECGWPREPVFGCGTPAEAPDLAAYIALASEDLSKIAGLLGKAEDAASWKALSSRHLDFLTGPLWDGAGFISVNALTGEAAPAGGLLGLMPLILGSRLPEPIAAVLAEKVAAVSWENAAVIPSTLILLGLGDLGREREARAGAAEVLKSCAAGGAREDRGKSIPAGEFYAPAVCAALLALGGTLQ
ncbi:hypothetical protein SAMN02745823_01789 [Sporobacter termitidis DSM 10068]|uniref:Mannosylglycerate hydrolase MGH1-like glycoside hydrolase domain-containing protein n=1 Tax=Sporobacter termitidis DSM 10068 TaxID=1123282 RepID=A0A1M5XGC1_9FIRM|nr:hypothetical protein [Sporobacter termitidis]SHH98789.1 hypothetical protein SAMN02745823_01789 [Sporobacter termitidis DSM 10068]